MWGVIMFTTLVSVGLILRSFLENLHLLLVPRLAAVLTIVIMLIAAFSIISVRLDMERGLSVALFPVVILAMTIERMSIVLEETGSKEAFKTGLRQPGGRHHQLPRHDQRDPRPPDLRVP
ncbi:MAG: 7TM domain-containing protein [Gammaproteobacteria bacterium]